jgi:hypothetical protein
MAIAHPYLHGTALENMEKEEPIGPVPIDVQNYDIGDDIVNGINAVDRARNLITDSRQLIRRIKYSSKLKERLLDLI